LQNAHRYSFGHPRQYLEILVGQPDPASLAPGVEAQVGGVPDVLAGAGTVPFERAFGQDQVVGLASFIHVLVVHSLDGPLADHDHAAFVLPFGQQAELACPETAPLLAELLEEPVGHLGVAVASAVLSIFFYDQHSKVLELAGWFPAGSEHDAAVGHDLLKGRGDLFPVGGMSEEEIAVFAGASG
jgi:hypothetical protein